MRRKQSDRIAGFSSAAAARERLRNAADEAVTKHMLWCGRTVEIAAELKPKLRTLRDQVGEAQRSFHRLTKSLTNGPLFSVPYGWVGDGASSVDDMRSWLASMNSQFAQHQRLLRVGDAGLLCMTALYSAEMHRWGPPKPTDLILIAVASGLETPFTSRSEYERRIDKWSDALKRAPRPDLSNWTSGRRRDDFTVISRWYMVACGATERFGRPRTH